MLSVDIYSTGTVYMKRFCLLFMTIMRTYVYSPYIVEKEESFHLVILQIWLELNENYFEVN